MKAFGRLAAVSLFILLPSLGRGPVRRNHGRSRRRCIARPCAVYTLLLTGHTADGRLVDRTREARYRSLDQKVAVVTAAGVVRSAGDGHTTIVAEIDGKGLDIAVSAVEATAPRRFNFENDVDAAPEPLRLQFVGLPRQGRGSEWLQAVGLRLRPGRRLRRPGQGGARPARLPGRAGRTACCCARCPARSPHGGGVRIPRRLQRVRDRARDWIAAGIALRPADRPEGRPPSASSRASGSPAPCAASQQLRVVARYSDGREVDVTAHARFQSNNDGLASVQPSGLVPAGEVPGEAAVMASFMNAVDVFRADRAADRDASRTTRTCRRTTSSIGWSSHKLRKLNVLPSGRWPTTPTYLRRVYLDVIGTLPTPARRGVSWPTSGRTGAPAWSTNCWSGRSSPTYWALQWADLLRVDRQALGPQAGLRLLQLDARQPGGQQAVRPVRPRGRDGRGAAGARSAPASFYKVVTKPGEAASTLSQVFLGVRIACAECHHHPFDRWSQDDYYGMHGLLRRTGRRDRPAAAKRSSCRAALPRPATRAPARTFLAHALGEQAARVEAPHAGRPPRRPGRLDDQARQSVVRPQPGQPRLGPLPGPRPGRAGR